jgi:N-acetylglucosaminyldiphosphoundecaprenol N-acetyl-beta-D-mannosaminyltransferase
VITANVDYLQRFASSSAIQPLFRQAEIIVADGIPLLWAARLQGTPLPDRVAGSDLVWLLADRAAARGFSLYLLGGSPGAAERAAKRFAETFPGLRIAGFSSPQLSESPTPAEIEAVRTAMAQADPDIVYVALGSPKTENLIAALRASFPHAWWLGVGISLSFVAGMVRRAPVWMQRWGVEWLHRLVQEPGRLWRRYLMLNLPFAVRLLLNSWRARRPGVERSATR